MREMIDRVNMMAFHRQIICNTIAELLRKMINQEGSELRLKLN